ncbi:putative F-box domain-containing protein [Medicago truncatula]|uniref:F-box protein interaction domain protein n=1 Tax=Medicago truncatula TaxID=3880 RepID=A0A072VI40_MEDTR|nr:F-box/kelch-repeat protein At3g23880 [Medicago truncatula]KEH37800.1 F-box protein interaction domain protein [Medicago truncatula]RHN73876.1 putative F-box domain-containing protein [Medicago truncatula]
MRISPSKSPLRRKGNTPSPVILPDELVAEVLSFLPVNSLMQLKCVSKSWNSLISDPFFVKLHLIKSSRNPLLSLFSTQSSNNSISAVLTPMPMRCIREITNANHDTKYLLAVEEYYMSVGSCNGLICMLHDSSDVFVYRDLSLRFWNPATRSLSDKLDYFCTSVKELNFKFSYGYDNLTNKYKVVAFRPNEVKVFTLGENIWRNIQSFPVDPYYCTHNPYNCGVYLSNSINWFAVRNHENFVYGRWKDLIVSVDEFVIISLDLGMETYTQLRLPQALNEVPYVMPTVSILMNCLCFTHYSKGNHFVIWQMREFGVEDSWIQLFKFRYQHQRCIGVRHGYCNLLPLHVLENDDTLLLVNGEQFIRYNRRENRLVKLPAINECLYLRYAKHYIESLVSTC